MTYGPETYNTVISCVEAGLSDYAIAAATGVPRATVRRWRLAESPPRTVRLRRLADSWKVRDGAAYCYLLGIYLGDGTVVVSPPNCTYLQVVNDRLYQGIADEIQTAMRETFPEAAPRRHPSSAGASDVLCITHPAVLRAFPQHGAGRKHLRTIALTDWQLGLTRARPDALIRGLIHSDGCRAVNRFRTKLPSGRIAQYEYVRYFFSNLSEDIREIFVDHCALLGVRVTQSNHRNMSVSHRDSVAILERIAGPKR